MALTAPGQRYLNFLAVYARDRQKDAALDS
jgi:hypothetical protein